MSKIPDKNSGFLWIGASHRETVYVKPFCRDMISDLIMVTSGKRLENSGVSLMTLCLYLVTSYGRVVTPYRNCALTVALPFASLSALHGRGGFSVSSSEICCVPPSPGKLLLVASDFHRKVGCPVPFALGTVRISPAMEAVIAEMFPLLGHSNCL